MVSVDEIAGVRWQCATCHAAITFQLDQTITFPAQCPNCRTPAVPDGQDPAHRAMGDFVRALKALRRLQQDHPEAGAITLEFTATPRP